MARMKTGVGARQVEDTRHSRTLERQRQALDVLEKLNFAMTPNVMDASIDEADEESGGDWAKFSETFERLAKERGRQRQPSELDVHMDDSLTPRERALFSLRELIKRPNVFCIDTETTGLLGPQGVPWSIAATSMTGEKILDIEIAPLDSKGGRISMSKSALAVHGVTDADIWQARRLEDPHVLKKFDALPPDAHLVGYYCEFDREMIKKAFLNAGDRLGEAHAKRVMDWYKWFSRPERWTDLKGLLLQASGINPNSKEGRQTKLEHLAYRCGVLKPDEMQKHSALADCQLLAATVQVICGGTIVATQNPFADPGVAEEEDVPEEQETGEPDPEKELVEENRKLKAEVEKLKQQATDAKAVPSTHHESRVICFTDIQVGDYPINVTTREGASAQMVADTIITHLQALRIIKDNEKIVRFGVGEARAKMNFVKGGPKKDQPPAKQEEADPSYDPNGDKPAQPRKPPAGGPPAGGPPKAPPKQEQQKQQTGGGGSGNQKEFGSPGSQRITAITKVMDTKKKGVYNFEVDCLLDNGKPTQHAREIKGEKAEILVKALEAVGFGPMSDSWEVGEKYPLDATNHWTWGAETEAGSNKYWHDNESWEIRSRP